MPSNGEPREVPTPPSTTALNAFFRDLEERTTDPVHQRLIKAARKADPAVALDRELAKLIKEIVDET